MKRLAIALMLPGLLILGFLAWQYVGTNSAASDSQNAARESITQSIEAQGTPAEFRHIVNRDPTKSEPIKPKKIKVGSKYVASVGLLSIPSIGVKNEPVVDDFSQTALNEGLIASMGTPPGSVGNFVTIGHVVTHGQIFARLRELRQGDLVTVKTVTGTFTYKIRGGPVAEIVDTDTWVLRANPSKTKKLTATKSVITLLTCAELFHSNRRIAIFGDLVTGTP